jgi:hypothetical protein
MQDRRVTVRELAEEVGISTGSVHSILTDDLSMRRVSAKFVPKLLTIEQKQLRLEVAQDMLDSANSDPEFLNIVTTGDESWVYGYDGDLSHETTLYGTRRPSCTPFAKRHSRNASNNGGTAGRSVFIHKDTTAKGIRFADLQVCKCIFPGPRSDTFLNRTRTENTLGRSCDNRHSVVLLLCSNIATSRT